MALRKLYIFITLLLACNQLCPVFAAEYNINVNNGLPANYVYFSIRDKLGYLWIATIKGVVRYNGYELKLFNMNNGPANDDVWSLYEDKKGRIWLSSISDEIGYIYNDRYKKAVVQNGEGIIYPRFLTDHNGGLIFSSSVKNGWWRIFAERNDTIRSYDLPEFPSNQWDVYIEDNADVRLQKGCDIYMPAITVQGPVLHKIYTGNIFYPKFDHSVYFVSPWLVCYTPRNGVVPVFNIDNGEKKQLTLFTRPDESVYNHYAMGDHYYFISNKNVYQFSRRMDGMRVFSADSLLPKTNVKGRILSYLSDSIWGHCINTDHNGIFINLAETRFVKAGLTELTGYKYVGDGAAGYHYWWNEERMTTSTTDRYNRVKPVSNLPFKKVEKVLKFNDSVSVFIADYALYAVDGRGEKFSLLEPYLPRKPVYKGKYLDPRDHYLDCFVQSSLSDFYSVGRGGGMYHYTFDKDTISWESLSRGAYSGICFQPVFNSLIGYGKKNIFIYDLGQKKGCEISSRLLNAAGIKKLEYLLADTVYGNIFVKDNDKLLLFNYRDLTCRELFRNFNLSYSHAIVQNGKLIVAGKFGVVFSKITGPGKVSQPVWYANAKNTDYGLVYDVQMSENELLLNTDKGFYKVNMPGEHEFYSEDGGGSLSRRFRFIVTYADSSRVLQTGDSLNILPGDDKIKFDVVNPQGVGNLRFRYGIAGVDADLNETGAGEFSLPPLAAGNHYLLSVFISDDVIKSNEILMHLYIVPLWWQTFAGRLLLFVAAVVFLSLLAYLLIYLTKRNIQEKNRKRNAHLELELRSIYSQINPHFIFNTLNSAQLLIRKNKTEEAYSHINKFSKLLRSYIKSSRNKLMTLSEEIENLKHYIELQQVRFKGKFEYEIIIEGQAGEQLYIPSLLLQPLVENAINHGLFHKEDTGHLKIIFTFDKEKRSLRCVIDDDGIGRESSGLLKEQSSIKQESYGSQLITDLIDIFNQYEDMNIEISYIDKQLPLTGTIVILEIKNIRHEN